MSYESRYLCPQLRECKEFAEKNDITIIGEYIDRALSAKTDNRPNFQKMIKDSYRKVFDTIIVWKVDRFARNRYDSAHYKNILKKNGVKVISAKEHIIETAIYSEQLQKPEITKEHILCYIERYRKINVNDLESRKRLIDTFVNSIYLYDDKIVFTFTTKTVQKRYLWMN